MVKSLLDTDKLNLVGLRRVGNAAMAVTSGLQGLTKEEQIVGAAAHFILLCRAFNVHAPDMFNIADRVIASQHEDRPELAAAYEYMIKELL